MTYICVASQNNTGPQSAVTMAIGKSGVFVTMPSAFGALIMPNVFGGDYYIGRMNVAMASPDHHQLEPQMGDDALAVISGRLCALSSFEEGPIFRLSYMPVDRYATVTGVKKPWDILLAPF